MGAKEHSSDKSFNPFWDSLRSEQLTPLTGVEAVRETIRRTRSFFQLVGDSHGKTWFAAAAQARINQAWQAWRDHLPSDLPPPKRPIVGSDLQKAYDALDELQRELNRLFPPTSSAQEGEIVADSDRSKEEQVEESDERTREKRISELPPAVRKAYLSFEAARLKAEKKDMKDSEAYQLLKKEGIPEDNRGELTDYRLPAQPTWLRYLGKARHALGEQKYTRRRGRSHGKSIVGQDQIETREKDDE